MIVPYNGKNGRQNLKQKNELLLSLVGQSIIIADVVVVVSTIGANDFIYIDINLKVNASV